ncbi:CCHC-type domain-containing protein [Pleurotus pulmonarius]
MSQPPPLVDFSHMREPTRTVESSPESHFAPLSPISTHTSSYNDHSKGRSPDMMPGPGEKAAPARFKGDYDLVRQFIRKYNRLCAGYNLVDPKEKCERLVDYCSRSVRLFIESLTSYQSGNWAQLEKDILKYYDADLDETRYIPDQLAELAEEWQNIKISDLTTWKSYQREFFTKAGWLRSKGKVTSEMEAGYFWQGIHRKFRQDIELRLFATNPNIKTTTAYPIELVSKIAEGLLERNRFEYSLMGINTERPEWYTQTESDDSDSDSSDDERHRKAKRRRERRHNHSRSSKKEPDTDSEAEYKKKLKSARSKRHSIRSKSRKDKEKDEVEQLITQMSHMQVTDPSYAVVYYKAAKLDPLVVDIVRPPSYSQSVQQTTPAKPARVTFSDQP